MLELQELVLVEGREHWGWLARTHGGERVERGRSRLTAALDGEPIADHSRTAGVPGPRRDAWLRRPWFVASATAASVLLAVFALDRVRRPAAMPAMASAQGRGWSRPGALSQGLGRGPYLARLADEANEWFARRPDGPVDLARRIGEFRQGCSTLILADHAPLPAGDRAWLVQKCRAWAARLEPHQADVEAGEDPATVRAEVDETARQLIAALRERAKPA